MNVLDFVHHHEVKDVQIASFLFGILGYFLHAIDLTGDNIGEFDFSNGQVHICNGLTILIGRICSAIQFSCNILMDSKTYADLQRMGKNSQADLHRMKNI